MRALLTMEPRSLASRIVRLERAEFVGRRRELLIADGLFERQGGVLLVHGPAGIGKSMLLREVARRGAAAGWTPVALAAAHELPRPLVLLDDADGLSLRERLRTLPARAVVVVATRAAPDPGWSEGGWETVTIELALSPFSAADSRALLERLGLAGDRRASAIVNWAGGLPRALRLGALTARDDAGWSPGLERETVREALRNFQLPAALAASPLATGRGVEGARALLRDAAERAFGDTPDEQLLRRVLIRGYFEPAGSHEAAARELHLSRAAYFRRLRSASERLAAWFGTEGAAAPPDPPGQGVVVDSV